MQRNSWVCHSKEKSCDPQIMIVSSIGCFLGGAPFHGTYRCPCVSPLPQFCAMALFWSQFTISKLKIRKSMSQHFNIPREVNTNCSSKTHPNQKSKGKTPCISGTDWLQTAFHVGNPREYSPTSGCKDIFYFNFWFSKQRSAH